MGVNFANLFPKEVPNAVNTRLGSIREISVLFTLRFYTNCADYANQFLIKDNN
ncbi:MAG: hypothetical protein K0S32_70 [Bacteroidetes bacterium]|jgi:hypothetical protein|nr:hypothetical protein [Bacteroidota bacterium]